MSESILVTGAAGRLGRRVIHHLLNTVKVLPGNIIATTRRPDELRDLGAIGVRVRGADFENAGSLADAFAGAGRMLPDQHGCMGPAGQTPPAAQECHRGGRESRRSPCRLHVDTAA